MIESGPIPYLSHRSFGSVAPSTTVAVTFDPIPRGLCLLLVGWRVVFPNPADTLFGVRARLTLDGRAHPTWPEAMEQNALYSSVGTHRRVPRTSPYRVNPGVLLGCVVQRDASGLARTFSAVVYGELVACT